MLAGISMYHFLDKFAAIVLILNYCYTQHDPDLPPFDLISYILPEIYYIRQIFFTQKSPIQNPVLLHRGYKKVYLINIASPNEKNRYLSFTASSYAESTCSFPANADTSMTSVDSGRWKLVIRASRILNR